MVEPGRDVEPDFEAFCEYLNRHRVEYVIVGSEAVAVHGAPRYSQAFDAFIRANRENAGRLLAALEEFGFGDPASAIDIDAWLARGQTLELGRPPNQIHVLTRITWRDVRRGTRAARGLHVRFGPGPLTTCRPHGRARNPPGARARRV